MKVLLKVLVPAIQMEFDMKIPDFITVEEIIPLIIDAINEISTRKYITSGVEILCYKSKNIILASGNTLCQYDIKNGDTLILI